MHIKKQLGSLSCFAFILFLSGCMPKHQNAIFFSTNTLVGLKVGTNVNQVPEIDVGYQRQEAAYVPVYVELGDGFTMTKNDSLVAQYLGKALNSIEAAYNRGVPDTDAKKHIDVAKLLVADAQSVAAKPPSNSRAGKQNEQTIFDLTLIKTSTDALDATKSTPADYKRVIDLIEIQLERPEALVAFYEQGKYISEYNANGRRTDAYSVLGTFSGDMDSSSRVDRSPASGGSSIGNATASMKGGVAQYFATGIAAQLLAEKGGAAAVSSAPVVAEKLSEDDILKKAKIIYVDRSDKITAVSKYILDASDGAERKQRVVTILDGAFYPGTPDTDKAQYHDYFSAITDQEELFSKLMTEFSDQADILYKNITK